MPLWADCPAATRLVCVGPPVLSLVMMLVEATSLGWLVDGLFTCSVMNVFHRFLLWTLFIGPFYTPISGGMAFLMTIFTVYMAMLYLPSREKELGSATFVVWMLLMNALTSLIYLLVMFIMATIYRGTFSEIRYLNANFQGLWPLIIICLTLNCLANSTGSTSFWGLVMIPNKWYPLCLSAFFCVLNGMTMMWDFAAALVIGYAYGRLRFDRLLLSRATMARIEQRCCGGGRAFLGGSWVPVGDVDPADRRYSTLTDFGRSGGGQQMASRNSQPSAGDGESATRPSAGFQAFAGSGNRLGDGVDIEAHGSQLPQPQETSA